MIFWYLNKDAICFLLTIWGKLFELFLSFCLMLRNRKRKDFVGYVNIHANIWNPPFLLRMKFSSSPKPIYLQSPLGFVFFRFSSQRLSIRQRPEQSIHVRNLYYFRKFNFMAIESTNCMSGWLQALLFINKQNFTTLSRETSD